MRAFKMTFALMLLLASVVLTGMTFLKSHGAGIATGLLLGLVTICYIVDHRHHLFGKEPPTGDGKKSAVRTVALRQGRLTAMHQEGAFARRGN
ncbi:MAG TPA: hypothetical protein VF449_06450 [Parvibaculum sp.]